MIDDLPAIATELLKLVKALEFEKATELVRRAHRARASADFECRQQTVHTLTLAIVTAKRQRARLLQEVENFPQAHRLFAQAEIECICRSLFDAEIASLTAAKRRLSQPRQN